MRKAKDDNGVTEFEIEPRAGMDVKPNSESEDYEQNYANLPATEKKKEIKKLFVTSKNTIQELAEMFLVPVRTIQDWASKDDWRSERDKIEIMSTKLKDSLKWLLDPNTEESALSQGNLKVLLEIQGIHLAHMKYAMLSGDQTSFASAFPSGLADAIQKYAGALEKLNKTAVNLKNDGVDKSEVVHRHQIDMDQALQLAMRLKKETGKVITVTDAARILDDQMKGKTSNTDQLIKKKEKEDKPVPEKVQIVSKPVEVVPDAVRKENKPKIDLSRFNIAKKK